jgi:hypothetical protein
MRGKAIVLISGIALGVVQHLNFVCLEDIIETNSKSLLTFRLSARRILLCALILGITASLVVPSVLCTSKILADEPSEEARPGHNIAIVLDASGSLEYTDPEQLRFEALNKFIVLLSQKPGAVSLGGVVFSEDIPVRQELIPADDWVNKQQVMSALESITHEGWTNIGLGLNTGVDLLDEAQSNNAASSFILFISDGTTDMPTESAMTRSLDEKANAVMRAREAGYPIHTICLNVNGEADMAELQQIADSTGGRFEEVSSPEDLVRVSSMLNAILFPSGIPDNGKSGEYIIPESGVLDIAFTVPPVGVEEVNIVFEGAVDSYGLVDPQGSVSTYEDLQANLYQSRTFDILKLRQPLPGAWQLQAYGTSGDKVVIEFIYNSDLSAQLSTIPESASYQTGDIIELRTQLFNGEEALVGSEYEGFSATLVVTDVEGIEARYPMESDSDGLVYSYAADTQATLTAYAIVEGNGYTKTTQELTLNIGNAPPVAEGDIEKTDWLLPFFSPSTAEIDLSGAAKDIEDSTLTYTVLSSSFLPDEYSIEGSVLKIHDLGALSMVKGSFTIQAKDSQGASCTFNVSYTTIPVGMLGLAALVLAALVVVLILYIGWRSLMGRRIKGSITVDNYPASGGSVPHEPTRRGRYALSQFDHIDNSYLNLRKCYFLPTKLPQKIMFQSNKPVYFGNSTKAEKKKEIGEAGCLIYFDKQHSQGIEVRYELSDQARDLYSNSTRRKSRGGLAGLLEGLLDRLPWR